MAWVSTDCIKTQTHSIYRWKCGVIMWCCIVSPENLRILSLGRNNIKALTGLVSYIWNIVWLSMCFIIMYFSFFLDTVHFSFLHFVYYFVLIVCLCVSVCVCVQEAVGDTLEELWISYNLIEKLKGIQCMKNLKVLYMSNNLVKEWGKLQS